VNISVGAELDTYATDVVEGRIPQASTTASRARVT
jgi:hypothetical protein